LRSAVWVLSLAAFAWIAAILLSRGCPLWMLAVPGLVSAACIALAYRWPEPPRSEEEGKRIGRLIGLWTAFEGVAIPVSIVVLQNTGGADAIPSAVAIIVGIHFLGIGRGLSRRAYLALGAGLILAGLLGLLLPAPQRLTAVGAVSACLLWGTALLVCSKLRRGRE
jgi:hypothetical protein